MVSINTLVEIDLTGYVDPSRKNATDLATYAIASGSIGEVVKERLPMNVKKYLRLKLTGSASITGNGKITAGLVLDVNKP